MKKKLWHKRIPTSAAFLLLFISIWVTSFLLQKGAVFIGQATPDKTPQNVKIYNVSDSSFAVAFATYDKTVSALLVDVDSKNSNTIFDYRDKKGEANFNSHFIVVSGLSPNHKYSFSILSEGQTFNNGDSKYIVKTGPKISSKSPNQKLISGKVILPDGTPAPDTIVQLQVPNAQSIATVTDNNGSYKIQANIIRSANLSTYIRLGSSTEIVLKFSNQNLESTIKSIYKSAATIPTVTLSYKYDFTRVTSQESATASSQLQAPVQILQAGVIKILKPVPGQSYTDSQPVFQGIALPTENVSILINPDSIKATLVADRNGFWSYRPSGPLSPGAHTLTIKTPNNLGISKTLIADFNIFSLGTRVTESATPSATPVITLAPTFTPTPTTVPTVAPTATPTIAVQTTQNPTPTVGTVSNPTPTTAPTAAPTLIALNPTSTPTPTVAKVATNAPTAKPKLTGATPVPTGSSSTVVFTFISVILITAGSALLFIL